MLELSLRQVLEGHPRRVLVDGRQHQLVPLGQVSLGRRVQGRAEEIRSHRVDVDTGGRVTGAVASVEIAQGSHGVEGGVIDHSGSYQFVLLQRQGVAGEISFQAQGTVQEIAAAEGGRGRGV